MFLLGKRNIFGLLPLLLILGVGNHLKAQVTIGSDRAPIEGALLDLTQETVATKGLMLPRVALSALNELKMGDNAPPVGEYSIHTGLMVYNVKDVDNCPTSTSINKGVYVWNGLHWEPLAIMLNEDITEYYDQDGNKFLAREFGTAGTWMIENLRAKTYDPRRDGVDPTSGDMTGPAFNENFEGSVLYWAYPSIEENTDPANSSLYDANPSLGLLYTWGAASRGQGDQYYDEGGEGTEGYPITIRQGVCPSGWHLPTDKEWTLLENEIQSNTSKYSTMADIGGIGIIGESSTANLLSPLTDKCEPHSEWSVGTSKPKGKGGFANLYAGQIEGAASMYYGKGSYYWTGSMHHYMVYLRAINVDMYVDENIQRIATGSYATASVRCKKN